MSPLNQKTCLETVTVYKVVFIKHIVDAQREDPDARFAVLTREETLPFAPVPGQEIQWPLLPTQKIISSAWSTEHMGFRCRLEDKYAVSLRLDALDFDDYLEAAPMMGWKICATYPAQVR